MYFQNETNNRLGTISKEQKEIILLHSTNEMKIVKFIIIVLLVICDIGIGCTHPVYLYTFNTIAVDFN